MDTMTSPIPDLWPEQIAESDQVSPLSILNEQAALLGKKTQGFVEGEVARAAIPMSPLHRGNSLIYLSAIGEAHEVPKAMAPKEPTLVYSFYLKVPALDNYRFLLLTVMHGHEFYPLALSYMITNESVSAKSEEEFLHWLGQFLARKETVSLIQSLREQARAVNNTSGSQSRE
jgi:hypothetical protein